VVFHFRGSEHRRRRPLARPQGRSIPKRSIRQHGRRLPERLLISQGRVGRLLAALERRIGARRAPRRSPAPSRSQIAQYRQYPPVGIL
jgi:hypothetical protein